MIVYALKYLRVQERNCLTHDLDLVVVVFALKIQRNYLCGVHFEIYTGHHNLQYIYELERS